jgi:endonuclease III
MKNSKEYTQRLQKLHRELKRSHPKVEKATYDDPADALICGIISERMKDSAAQRALREIKGAFVDWNDLRVARPEEIAEAMGEDSASSRATAVALTSALKCIFDEHHKISLQYLKKLGKRPARQGLEKLDGVSRFAVNYCMLTSMQAHAIPLTAEMVDYLKRHGIVDTHAGEQDVEGFLTRLVPAKDAYEFYVLLRHESESPRLTRKKAAVRVKSAAARTRAKK